MDDYANIIEEIRKDVGASISSMMFESRYWELCGGLSVIGEFFCIDSYVCNGTVVIKDATMY